MEWLQSLQPERLLIFGLILSRVSGLIGTSTFFSWPEIPWRFRILIALALSGIILPLQWNAPLPVANEGLGGWGLILSEWLIGVSFGLATGLFFSAVQLAGELAARTSGLLLADMFDPNTGEQVPVLSQLYWLIAVCALFLTGGHRAVVVALLESFRAVPLGAFWSFDNLWELLTQLLAEGFLLAVRAAAPVVVALTAATMVLGLLSRTVPQLNILAVGFTINSLLVLVCVAATLTAVALVFQEHFDSFIQNVSEALSQWVVPVA